MAVTQAPPVQQEGAGTVLPPMTGTRTTHTKKTNLLSALSPSERRAVLQEQLDQAAIFRQIACAKNGVTGPINRNVIDTPSEEEVRHESITTGLTEEEVRRREELARREAEVALREQLLNASNTQGGLDVKTPSNTDAATLDDAKREQDLKEREDALARREAALAEERKLAIQNDPALKPSKSLLQQWGPTVLTYAGLPIAGALLGLYLNSGKPDVQAPVDPAPVNDTTPTVNSDAQLLMLLQSKGMAAPKTPLGENVMEAFERDPALRERVMLEIEKTLKPTEETQ